MQQFQGFSPLTQLGASLGAGLREGLEELSRHKMQEIQTKKLQDLFQQRNFDEPTSALLAHIYQTNPEHFHQILPELTGGQKQQGPGGQSLLEQKELTAFADERAKDFNSAKKIYDKANGMLRLLRKHKKDWPGYITGQHFPTSTHRKDYIRKYIADANTLVSEIANARKGQPTNFKIKLEQAAKPGIEQPYQTQVDLLEDLIKSARESFSTHREIAKIKEENGGIIPRDIRTRLVEKGLESIENEDNLAEYRGDIIDEDPTTGTALMWNSELGRYKKAAKRKAK